MDSKVLDVNQMIIAVGSFLYNSGNTIADVDSEFLTDLHAIIGLELERREAVIH